MNAPKLHHYVPQFYLRRFLDRHDRLWVWDKIKDVTFATSPGRIAAETNFYFLTEFVEQDHDPLTMEKQFSDIEYQVSIVTAQWLAWLSEIELGERIEIPLENRRIVSLYVALQFLRTADSRDTLSTLLEVTRQVDTLAEEERRRLHTHLLWDDKIVNLIANRICTSTWIFGRNSTLTPFVTSDNPVAFRTADNAMWLKAAILSNGAYVVFPLSPTIVMYCHPNEPPWEKFMKFDTCLSPVEFTAEMLEDENSAQAFMASRFVISQTNAFDRARDFAKTIGTDRYART